MNMNDISLITPAVVQAARTTSAANAPAQGNTVQFQATVTSAQPPTSTNPQWQLTVSDRQRSLTLSSDRPLPPGSQLTLSATVSADPEQPPQVRVIAIQLPPGTGLPQTATDLAVTKMPLLAEGAASPLSGQLLRAAAKLRHTSGQAPAPLPQAVKDLLASRIRFSSAPQTPSASRPMTADLTYGSAPQLKMSVQAQNSPGLASGTATGTAAPAATLNPQATLQTPLSLLSKIPTSSSPLPLLQLLNNQPQQLPAPVRSAISEFISRLPTAEQLSTPAGVRTALNNAPVSFERTLLQAPVSSERPADTVATSTAGLFRQLWRPLNQASGLASPQSAVPAGSAASASPATTDATASASGVAGLKSLIQQFARNAGVTAPVSTPESPPTQISSDIPLPTATGHNVKALLLHLLKHWPGADTAVATSVTTAGGLPADDGVPEMFRLLQQAVSQIEHEQVRLLHAQEPLPTAVPLLWRHGEHPHQAQMNFADGHNSRSDQAQKRQRWQLTLHFDLENLGPLDVELDLMPPSVSATFWSEQSPTLAALNSALQPLRRTLQELGADVGELQARHGRRPLEDQPLIRHSLVDIHT